MNISMNLRFETKINKNEKSQIWNQKLKNVSNYLVIELYWLYTHSLYSIDQYRLYCIVYTELLLALRWTWCAINCSITMDEQFLQLIKYYKHHITSDQSQSQLEFSWCQTQIIGVDFEPLTLPMAPRKNITILIVPSKSKNLKNEFIWLNLNMFSLLIMWSITG